MEKMLLKNGRTLISGMVLILLSVAAFSQNVGIGQAAPVSKLDVDGNLTIGTSYSGASTAPANGAIIEGNTGIGTPAPAHQLHVEGDVRFVGDFVNQEITGDTSNGQFIPFSSPTVTLNNSVVSVTINDGNGVNHSGVLVLGNIEVFSATMAFSGDRGYAAFRITLERAEDPAFTTNLVTLQGSGSWMAELWSDYNNGLGASGGNTTYTNGLIGNASIIYTDLNLNPGTTYFYRLRFTPLSIGTITAGSYSVSNSAISLVQVKR